MVHDILCTKSVVLTNGLRTPGGAQLCEAKTSAPKEVRQ